MDQWHGVLEPAGNWQAMCRELATAHSPDGRHLAAVFYASIVSVNIISVLINMSSQYERFSEALIHLLKNWRSALDARFRPFGLSQARWHVLLKLLRAKQALAQCDLAMRVGIEPASLVRLLDALEGEGLVRREADLQDRRAKRISLTEAGHALALELAAIADAMRTELLANVSPEALAQTIEVLECLERQAACLQEAEAASKD